MQNTLRLFLNEYRVIFFLFLFSIIISRTLFYFSGYILEDSFIVFRSTFNYADYGIYSFNLDEQHTGVTSKLFGLICTLFRIIFKNYAILFILAFNVILSILSSFIFYEVAKNFLSEKNNINKNFLLLFIIFFNPAILIIGNTGLEYSLVILFISFLFYYIISDDNNYYILICCCLLPATRFELIAVNLIFIFLFFIFSYKKFLYLTIFSFFGLFINFGLNLYYDGTIFPSSAISKWMTLSKSNHYDMQNLFNYFSIWFLFSKSFFSSVTSKFIPNFVYLISSIIIMIFVFFQFRYLNILKFKNIDEKYKIFILALSLNIIFVPLSYVISGHAFLWYFFPFSFLTYCLLAILFINSAYFTKILIQIFSFTIFILLLFQFLVLKNIGFQENVYRSNVGQYIYENSNADDTMFLEPAGYIPFFAKIKTFDTVGLTSPVVRNYRKKDQIKNWWFEFVYNEKPNFVIDRRDVSLNGEVRDGLYMLTIKELDWFNNNYTKIKEFKYKEYIKKYGGGFKAFYNLGSHSDYYIFKLNKY